MSLKDAIVEFVGIESAIVADYVSALVFGVGILMIVAILTKSIFKIV